MMENVTSATTSSKESSDELQLSCGKKTKCAVSSNRHDMDSSSMGGKREAASGGMVEEENNQVVNTNATMQKEKSSATKMKPRLNHHSNIIIRKRKVTEDDTLSKQEKVSKSKRKKERCQAEDEIANKDAKQNERKKLKTSDYHLAVPAGIDEANMDEGTDMHTANANDINVNANAKANANANTNANDAHTNAQLSIYQSALAMSERQKSQVVAENQILRQSCAQARIVINDVISPVQVATGEEKVAADLTNDITETETEALATMESHSLHAHACQVHPHAHAHHQIHSPHTDGQHHHAHHASMTPNTAGLSARLEKWESRFRDLAAYKEQHGDCLVPRNYNGSFGRWVSTQRTLFTSKKIKADRYDKLVGIGFVLEDAKFPSNNVKWNTRFVELERYKEKNGHCNVPTTNGSLRRWILHQKTLLRSKKLNADRYDKLVGIGFVLEDARFASDNVRWNTRFVELEKYKEKNGHCNCPITNGSFGRWVSAQRTLLRSKKLNADRHEKLVGIGFVLEDAKLVNSKTKSEYENWNRLFVELVEYKKKNGHFNFPTKNGSLGRWINTQRNLLRSKKLKEDRYEKLVGIGFAFEDGRFAIGYEKWNKIFMELVGYKEKNGHCNFPTTNGGSLGRWISYQRTLFRSKKLNADCYEKLVGIGFVFEDSRFAIDNENWNKIFMKLVGYKEKNGHCNFPTKNGSFGRWINNQRTSFRSKKLNADRYEKLVGIGFVFEDGRFAMGNVKWNEFFMELVEYKEKNGHCNCPITNGSLGHWVKKQRRLFRSEKLKADRYEKLVGIGFA
eukprot:scaffold1904_cov280-Chaetoceros_neogracile.AAC.29